MRNPQAEPIMADMTVVDMMEMTDDGQVFLIWPGMTGRLYYQQTGGALCSHHVAEGSAECLPLHTFDLPHVGCEGHALTEAEADELDATLRRMPGCENIRVDRDRLNESTEAWVPVTAIRHAAAWRAILTYENCD